MKKLLVAFLTFGIGLFAFDLWNFKKPSITKFTPVQEITEIPQIQSSHLSPPKTISSDSFFKSFKEDEMYSGWLITDDFKGMNEVWTILLSKDLENEKSEKFVWSAMILTQLKDGSPNDDDNFHSVWIKAEDYQLSFRTNNVRGIEYRFSGKFFKDGHTFENEEKILKGTLQKFVKGKKIAEFTAEFYYFEPHCFH